VLHRRKRKESTLKNRISTRTLLVIVSVVAIAAVSAGAALAAEKSGRNDGQVWRDCMARNGVTLKGERPSLETVRAGLATCGLPWKRKAQAFAACMNDKGVILSSVVAGSGLGTDRLRAAAKECGLDPERVEQFVRERVSATAACMRAKGVAIPTEATNLRQALGALLLTDRQTLADAWEACRGELQVSKLPLLKPGG